MLKFVLVLITVTAVGAKLSLLSTQTNQELDIRCSIDDVNSTGISHVVSLVISKSGVNGQVVLASVTPFSDPVTHNLKEAEITKNMTWDGTGESFLNIHWSRATVGLNGDYMCKLNGLDDDNLPLLVTSPLKLVLKSLEPTFLSTPKVIEAGLTRSLNVKCSISDFGSAGVSEMISIEVSAFHEGVDQLLASVSIFDGVLTIPGTGDVSATGFIGNISKENFLQLRWPYPTNNNTGLYICEIVGLKTGSPVHFIRRINVTAIDPPRELLVKRIQFLEANKQNMTDENKELSTLYINTVEENKKLEEDLKRSTKIINNFKATCPNNRNYNFSCTFEDGMCGLIQVKTDDFDWTLNNGSTLNLFTGPNNDHTLNSTAGHYLYAKSSTPRKPGDKAQLETFKIDVNHQRDLCLSFWYNMRSILNVGALNVYVKRNGSLGKAIWTEKGNMGRGWKAAAVCITPKATDSTFSLVIEAEIGLDNLDDIAIDDLHIQDKPRL